MESPKIKKDLLKLREKWRQNPDYACFWSSPDNPKGLQLTPTIELGRLYVDMKIERHHSGYPGICNGGIPFTIIDGLMSWYLMSHLGRAGFTKEAKINYYRPLSVSRTYRFEVKHENSESGNALNSFSLKGNVYELNDDKPKDQKPLLSMKADFFLPNRKIAEQVLGVSLDGEELFPDE